MFENLQSTQFLPSFRAGPYLIRLTSFQIHLDLADIPNGRGTDIFSMPFSQGAVPKCTEWKLNEVSAAWFWGLQFTQAQPWQKTCVENTAHTADFDGSFVFFDICSINYMCHPF